MAGSRIELEIMQTGLNKAIDKKDNTWKPASLLVMSTWELMGYLMKQGLAGTHHHKEVDAMVVLGIKLDKQVPTETSIAHRETVAERMFWRCSKAFLKNGNTIPKLQVWAAVCSAVASHCNRTWHLTRNLIHRLRSWELPWIRKAMKLNPCPALSGERMGKAYNIRTANLIYRICDQHDIKMLPQRLLEGIHSEAWKEGQRQNVVGRCLVGPRLE